MDVVGLVVLLATLAVATAAGLWLRSRNGRIRTGDAVGGWALAGVAPGPGETVLLLQLSSPVCTPCRRTGELLTALHERRPDLVHREVDVADHPDVARQLGVMRTPTVVAFDRTGAELLRVSGVPDVDRLEASLPSE